MPSDPQSLVTVRILVNGSPVKEGWDVYEVEVSTALNRIASAEIRILDGDVATEDYSLSEGPEFIPGNAIEIQAGFGLTPKRIFKGIVVSQTIQIREPHGPMLIVRCRDAALKMTVGRNSGVFLDQTEDSILKTVAGRSGLAIEIDATPNKIPQMVQYGTSDWDFLVSRAEMNGLVVVTTGDGLEVKAPRTDASPEINLTFGVDIVEFESTVDASTQLKHVQAHAWDFKNQILASAKASEVAGTGQGNLSGPKLAEVASPDAVHLGSTVPFAAGELKSWADAKLLKSRLAKIGGRVKVFGNDALRPNQVIALAGLGARFNGPAFVSAVEHVIRDGNWWTVLGTGSSPHWFSEEVDVSAPVAAAQLPGIRGLQNGIVKSIAEDPEGETRIQVTVPMLTVTSEPGDLWARWVQPYATSKAGSFFLPEVGDEVLLGFLNEDPRYPVVLGSLYGTKHAPPYTPDSTNPKKAIVTRSELKVEFDDENKVLTIQTPGKNKLVLSDQDQGITLEDQNGNKITLAAGGITLKSAASITIQATNSVDVKGLGVSVASDAQASIKAQASLEVSSAEVSVSGQASLALKGGMITLN